MRLVLDVPRFCRLPSDDKAAVRSWLERVGFKPYEVVAVEMTAEDGLLDVVQLDRALTVIGDKLVTHRCRVDADGFPLRLLNVEQS